MVADGLTQGQIKEFDLPVPEIGLNSCTPRILALLPNGESSATKAFGRSRGAQRQPEGRSLKVDPPEPLTDMVPDRERIITRKGVDDEATWRVWAELE
jgi:hypothetical protein